MPGDAVLNDSSQHGQAKLILACIYVLVGLAFVSMTINLVQEEIVDKFRQLARDIGILDDDDEDDYSINSDVAVDGGGANNSVAAAALAIEDEASS